jgi:PAS domain S-box-containing protein
MPDGDEPRLPGTEERRFDGYLHLAMQGRSVQFEPEFVVADGSAHWVRISYTPDIEPDGSVAGALGVVHDLTEAHSTVRRAAELELRMVMQHVPAPIAYVTHEEVYRHVNLATETWLRRRRDEIVGRRLDEVLPAKVCERVRGCLAATRAGERVFYESRFTWADGSEHCGRVSFAPDHDAQGAYRGAYVALTDLTEHKQIEEALAASERHFRPIADELAARHAARRGAAPHAGHTCTTSRAKATLSSASGTARSSSTRTAGPSRSFRWWRMSRSASR